MLKQPVAALLALLLSASVAPPAAAWDTVCVRFKIPYVWYSGRFRVFYGMNQVPKENYGDYVGAALLQAASYSSQYDQLLGTDLNGVQVDYPEYNARGALPWSSVIVAGQTRCMPLEGVRDGEKFAVYVRPNGAGNGVGLVCDTHPDNPNLYYHQQSRLPYRRIHYDAWGSVGEPRCAFTHESN